MNRRAWTLGLTTLTFMLGLVGPAAQAAELTALVGATVHPISGPPIEDGVVLMRDGVIEAIGNGIEVPADAERLELNGKHIYPGFVHPLTPLGLSEIDSVRGSVDTREIGDNNSDIRAEVAFNADSLRLPAALAGGVTSALVYQNGGLFSGTSALMRLEGWNWRDMVVEAPVGLHLMFPAVPETDENDDEEATAAAKKALKELDQWLARARAYSKADRAGLKGLEANPKLERLVSWVEGDLRLFVHASGRSQIGQALDWLAEQDFEKVVLVLDYNARYLTDRLKEAGHPVLLNGVLDLPDNSWEPYDSVYGAANALHQAGVTFCIGDGGSGFGSSNARNLPFHAAMAAAYGLDRDQALRSITLGAAEILGIADRLGSLEPGKEASLMVTDGDPLESVTSIEHVFVAGRAIDKGDNHQYRLYRKYTERPKPAD